MRRMKWVILVVILFTTACSNKVDYVEEGVFVKLELYSASQEYYLDHFPKIITVSTDGMIKVFTEEIYNRSGEIEVHVGEDAPTIERELSEEEVEKIKETIEENRFFSLKEDVTDYDVMDGGGSKITVFTKDEEKIVGGENSSNEQYNTIEQKIYSYVEDVYQDWIKETKQYIYDVNETE